MLHTKKLNSTIFKWNNFTKIENIKKILKFLLQKFEKILKIYCKNLEKISKTFIKISANFILKFIKIILKFQLTLNLKYNASKDFGTFHMYTYLLL